MAGIEERRIAGEPGAAFAEGYAEAGGFRIRYLEAGHGPPLVCLHGEGGLRLSRAHDLLAERFRVVALEVPGFEASPENRPSAADGRARAGHGARGHRARPRPLQFDGDVARRHPCALARRPARRAPRRPRARIPVGHRARDRRARAEPRRRPRGPPRRRARAGAGALRHARPDAPESGSVYREKLGNAHLVFVYGAAREIGAERPEAFTALVADFLDRREQFVVGRARGLLHP